MCVGEKKNSEGHTHYSQRACSHWRRLGVEGRGWWYKGEEEVVVALLSYFLSSRLRP